MSSSPVPQPKLPDYLERVSTGTEGLPRVRRNPWKVIGATAVVVILVVAVIVIAGIYPHSGGATTTTPTFNGAAQAANSVAGDYAGGGWSVVAGLAFATIAPTEFTMAQVESVIGAAMCTVAWNPAAPAVVQVPATPATSAAGGASSWFFLYKNGALALLLVVVSNGTATPLFVASGGSCALVATGLPALATGSLVDSSTAIEAVNAKGGSDFLAAHPDANRTWAIVGQIPLFLSQPTWFVNYTLCPIPPPVNATDRSIQFNSTVDAETGITLSHGVSSTVCSLNLSFKLPTGPLHWPAGTASMGPSISALAPSRAPAW